MNSPDSLLGWAVSELQVWPNASEVKIVESRVYSENRFHFKVRAKLAESYQFQIRFYYNRGHLDYSYQLFTDAPILRWDNKEDAEPLPTSPHHFHNDKDEIVESPLNGDPAHDWPLVRRVLEQFMEERTKPDAIAIRFRNIELE